MTSPVNSANSYDSILYPSLAFLQTHPDRLAVLATLFGMNPAPVEHCRVLELACGNGSNVIPMAYGLPHSEFVGVDLAARPVQVAQDRIARLALKNIRIDAMDLTQIGPDFGKFDYIVAHGVYAWVPKEVQSKILAICKANLNPNGVAFISYNTSPAGHVRESIREMLRFHERRGPQTTDRVKIARHFLESIAKATDPRSPWKPLFEDELKLLFHRDERVVYHDDLADCFLPVSFGEFAARASHHGLQFLSEAHLSDLLEPEMSEDALESLHGLAGDDLIAYHQYLDFARYRRFRETLLCHAEIPLRSDDLLARLAKLLVASPLRAETTQPDGSVEFINTRGAGKLATNNPSIIAVLRRLEEIWPRAERFEDLKLIMRPLVPEALRNESTDALAQAVLKLAASTLADLRTHHLPLAAGVTDKPVASFLARVMAEDGDTVTTLLHTHVKLEDKQGREFPRLLDGTRDCNALTDAIASGSPNTSRETILKQVEGNLLNFYRMGLLTA